MEKLVINGKNKLYGDVLVQTAKNALLPLIASTIMVDGEVTFLNCPKLGDVLVMLEIIKSLGGNYCFIGDSLKVDCSKLYNSELPCELSQKIRASIFLAGPLIARFHKAGICLPGGCQIGSRPVDMHITALKKLGVEISNGDFMYCKTENLKGGEIALPYKSVGVTENLIMASSLASGTTTITNCAKEPEIVCLANFLNRVGAKIKGAGTDTIVIEGVKKLKSQNIYFEPIKDRIEIGTFMLAVMKTGGEISISCDDILSNGALIKKIINNACKLWVNNDKIYIKSVGVGNSIKYTETAPYPAFPTDLQSPFLSYLTTLKGVSILKETVFEDRLKVADELKKMGANLLVKGNSVVVTGVSTLTGANVNALDLRSGAGLIIAGLGAEGQTIINDAQIISRGYFEIHKKFQNLGADIQRVIK